MPGRLRCDTINLNELTTVLRLVEVLTNLARDELNTWRLNIKSKYHFSISNGSITSGAGWYIICDEDRRPIYVGAATNLNSRLNTDSGSRDNFANPKRTSDPVRNFIKAFVLGMLHSLFVTTISELSVCQQMGIEPPLTKRDRQNIEKVLSIFRVQIVGWG